VQSVKEEIWMNSRARNYALAVDAGMFGLLLQLRRHIAMQKMQNIEHF
jgi:hypothetical protein